jgi:hypothetical protein
MPKRAGSLKNTIELSDPRGLSLALFLRRRKVSHKRCFAILRPSTRIGAGSSGTVDVPGEKEETVFPRSSRNFVKDF